MALTDGRQDWKWTYEHAPLPVREPTRNQLEAIGELLQSILRTLTMLADRITELEQKKACVFDRGQQASSAP